MEENSYVYIHKTADTNIPFYVGKGFGQRAYQKFRSKWWQNTVNKHGYTIEFVKTDLSDEIACALEIELIKQIGRKDLGLGTLVNMTDGGDGIKNPSEETREKLRKIWTGRKHTEESKEKMHNAAVGKHKSQEHKDNIGKSQMGKIKTPETLEKISKALSGITHKDKGLVSMNDDWKQSISNSMKGKNLSEEHKKNLSIAAREAHQRKRIRKYNCG